LHFVECWSIVFSVSQETQKKRTWAAYACPMCRFVFRISKQYEGGGVVCPACQYLLKIPSEGGHLEDDTSVAQQLAAMGKEASQKRVKSEKVKKREIPFFWIISGAIFVALLAIMAQIFVTEPEREEISLESRLSRSVVFDESSELLGKPIDAPTAESLETDKEIQAALTIGKEAKEVSEKLLGKFFAVKNVEELAPLVRNPEVTMPRIRKWYESRPLKFAKIKKIGYRDDIRAKGQMASVLVQLADYSVKAVALEKTINGYRVDWESWVGWTELDWDDFFIDKPTEPKTVLVQCSIDTYYNRNFRDESKWVAVKMTNPQSYKTLYGYIDRSNPTLMRHAIDMGSGETRAIFKIRYPAGDAAENQVVITEVLASGWVVEPK